MLRKELGEKVKGIFYGEKKEVRDPVTNVIEKKSLKPLLVNQMVLLLERGQLRIPHLQTSEILHRQMINFRVTKVSATTKEPTYTDTDEHGLDAFIFAMTAYIDEYPNLVDIIEEILIETGMFSVKPNRVDAMANIESQLQGGIKKDKKGFNEAQMETRYESVPLGFSKRRKNSSLNNMGWKTGGGREGSVWRNKRW